MKIAICIPVYGDPKREFARSLADALIYLCRTSDAQITPFWATGSSIAWNRQNLAETALGQGADWLFWLDADHTFPPDTFVRLLTHRLPVVGCNYRRRTGDHDPVALRFDSGPVVSSADKPVEQVDRMGMGVCLIAASVFDLIQKPWFVEDPRQGEDGFFFGKLAKVGVRPHVDHALSVQVGHITESVLTFDRMGDDIDSVRPSAGAQ